MTCGNKGIFQENIDNCVEKRCSIPGLADQNYPKNSANMISLGLEEHILLV